MRTRGALTARSRLPTLSAMPRLLFGLFFFATACAYVMPASWRSYRADPDDAAPAITRALDERSISIAKWDQAEHRIVSDWSLTRFGVDHIRERYVVSWEKNEDEGTLTVYVRHEAQERELLDGAPSWGATYHTADKESALLDAITKALEEARAPMAQ